MQAYSGFVRDIRLKLRKLCADLSLKKNNTIESHVNNLSSQIGLTVHFNCSLFNLAKKVWQLDTKKLAGVEFRL